MIVEASQGGERAEGNRNASGAPADDFHEALEQAFLNSKEEGDCCLGSLEALGEGDFQGALIAVLSHENSKSPVPVIAPKSSRGLGGWATGDGSAAAAFSASKVRKKGIVTRRPDSIRMTACS